jgi:hypothetical protein
MYLWLTSASADFESRKSIKSDQIIRLFLCFSRRRTQRQSFPALQAHLSRMRK